MLADTRKKGFESPEKTLKNGRNGKSGLYKSTPNEVIGVLSVNAGQGFRSSSPTTEKASLSLQKVSDNEWCS